MPSVHDLSAVSPPCNYRSSVLRCSGPIESRAWPSTSYITPSRRRDVGERAHRPSHHRTSCILRDCPHALVILIFHTAASVLLRSSVAASQLRYRPMRRNSAIVLRRDKSRSRKVEAGRVDGTGAATIGMWKHQRHLPLVQGEANGNW